MTDVERRVRELLADVYTPEGVETWLNARNLNLGDAGWTDRPVTTPPRTALAQQLCDDPAETRGSWHAPKEER